MRRLSEEKVIKEKEQRKAEKDIHMEEIIGYMAAAVYLAGSGIEDLKKQSVPAWWLLQGMAAGVMWRTVLLCSGKSDRKEFIVCFLPGACLLILKKLSEAVGEGDGIAWIGICMFLGIKTGLIVLAITFVLAFFWSAMLMILKKAGRKSRIPFLTFSLTGFMLWTGRCLLVQQEILM